MTKQTISDRQTLIFSKKSNSLAKAVKLLISLLTKLNMMDSRNIKRLPTRLLKLRKEKKLTQKQMALPIGVSKPCIAE